MIAEYWFLMIDVDEMMVLNWTFMAIIADWCAADVVDNKVVCILLNRSNCFHKGFDDGYYDWQWLTADVRCWWTKRRIDQTTGLAVGQREHLQKWPD